SGFTVALGGTLNVGDKDGVVMAYNQALTDNGTVNFANGDTVTLGNNGNGNINTEIIVSGTLTASGTTFNAVGPSNISVNSGGVITPTNSTFNLTLYLPYTDVPALAGNVSFNAIEINPGTLPSGSTLTLNAIGTNTAGLIYVFPSGFTVALGGTLNV